MDGIFASAPPQRRMSSVPNQNGMYNNQSYQPYILHTTDEFQSAGYNVAGVEVVVPPHAVAFRTVDLTVTQKNPDGFNVQGGGKLGVYSYWQSVHSANPTQPDPTKEQQYELYDYTHGNLGEIGNEYWSRAYEAGVYSSSFNSIAQSELYYVSHQFNTAYNTALSNYLTAAESVVCKIL